MMVGTADIVRQHVVDALHLLMQHYKGSFPDDTIQRQTVLKVHPFGFEIPGHVHGPARGILLLENPGITQPSVEAMVSVLGSLIGCVAARYTQSLYLRVIECEVRTLENGRVHNDLYFEAGCLMNVFLVGGVNDYSGTGGSGGNTLETLFAFVSAATGLPIQRVRVRQPFAEKWQRRLHAEYDRQHSKQAG